MSLPTELLRTFAAVAESGSFTRAGRAVNRTQGAVSMQVKRLEELVGRPLLLRGGPSVELTPPGERLLGYARRILELGDEALAVVTAPALSGAVRLGSPEDYATLVLPQALRHFAVAHPQVRVEVRCDPTAALISLLARGELDLALATWPEPRPDAELVRREPVVWVAPEGWARSGDDPLPLALFHAGCVYRRWAMEVLDAAGIAYRVMFESPSLSGVLAAVSAGLAVAPVGKGNVPRGARVLGAKDGLPTLPKAAVCLHRPPPGAGRRSPVADALAEQLIEAFRRLATA